MQARTAGVPSVQAVATFLHTQVDTGDYFNEFLLLVQLAACHYWSWEHNQLNQRPAGQVMTGSLDC